MVAFRGMTGVSDDFVARLADRAAEAEKLRRLPSATVDDYRESGLARLLLPARYGGRQAEFPEILGVVRRMAHGCASSAWTLGFYTLHNWMLALFCEQAQDEVFVDGPVLCPAPLAPTGRGHTGRRRLPVDRAMVVGDRRDGRRLDPGRRRLRA
jgi:3-hydroxy-9,10-secoandrosta-1,3,5(10)-triene-9,17-dione monooxygenase